MQTSFSNSSISLSGKTFPKSSVKILYSFTQQYYSVSTIRTIVQF